MKVERLLKRYAKLEELNQDDSEILELTSTRLEMLEIENRLKSFTI